MCEDASGDELIAELKRVGERVDGSPRVRDMKDHGDYPISQYYSVFESWNDALKCAGYTVNHNQNATREALLKAIEELATDGEPPTSEEMDEDGAFSHATYYRHFDSFTAAVKEAGYKPYREPGKRVGLECEICGSTFEVTPSNTERRFCSSECFGEHRTGMYTGEDHWRYVERVEKECKRCGETFERAPWRTTDQDQFCSQNCYYEWQAEHAESFGYGEGWDESKREQVREKYNRRCQSCGLTEEQHKEISGKRLAVHHITPAKKIDDEQERNAVGNLIPLCISCHNDWEGIPLKPTLIDP